MMPSRKDFKFHVTPSDRQLWAIGMVAVQWSLLETMVTVFVHGITDESEDVRKRFDSTHSFKPRLDQWAELTEMRVKAPYKAQIHALINEVRQAQDQRDKIIHGNWGDSENAKAIEAETHGAFNWAKPHHPFNWKLDFGTIKKVAVRIDRIHTAMFDFAFSVVQPKGDEFTTIGDALKRISHTPDRP